jgi:hypothetical protein
MEQMALIDDIKDPAAKEAVSQLWQAVQALQYGLNGLAGDLPDLDSHYHKRISSLESKLKEVQAALGISDHP